MTVLCTLPSAMNAVTWTGHDWDFLYVGGNDYVLYRVDVQTGVYMALISSSTTTSGSVPPAGFEYRIVGLAMTSSHELYAAVENNSKLRHVQLTNSTVPNTPTAAPTALPTKAPTTFQPSMVPSQQPFFKPSSVPTCQPNKNPSMQPTSC